MRYYLSEKRWLTSLWRQNHPEMNIQTCYDLIEWKDEGWGQENGDCSQSLGKLKLWSEKLCDKLNIQSHMQGGRKSGRKIRRRRFSIMTKVVSTTTKFHLMYWKDIYCFIQKKNEKLSFPWLKSYVPPSFIEIATLILSWRHFSQSYTFCPCINLIANIAAGAPLEWPWKITNMNMATS